MKIDKLSRPWVKNVNHRHNERTKNDFYQSNAWKSVRNSFMKQHPKCVKCGAPSQVCDHKVRIADGGHPTDPSNLQAMCHPCHNKKDNNAGR